MKSKFAAVFGLVLELSLGVVSGQDGKLESDRFRESLSLVRDPRVEEHVTKLEAYVAELSKRITRPVSSPTPVP